MLAILVALVAVLLNGLLGNATYETLPDSVLQLYAAGLGIVSWALYVLFHWLIVRDHAKRAREPNESIDSAA